MPEIHFKVDEEHCTTNDANLTIRRVLELGKKKPADQYYLTRKEKGTDVDYKNLDQTVEVSNGDKFHAVFIGDMTTS